MSFVTLDVQGIAGPDVCLSLLQLLFLLQSLSFICMWVFFSALHSMLVKSSYPGHFSLQQNKAPKMLMGVMDREFPLAILLEGLESVTVSK